MKKGTDTWPSLTISLSPLFVSDISLSPSSGKKSKESKNSTFETQSNFSLCRKMASPKQTDAGTGDSKFPDANVDLELNPGKNKNFEEDSGPSLVATSKEIKVIFFFFNSNPVLICLYKT